jgi:uncharacterized protein with GYD domain
MPKYMISGSYTTEGTKGLLKEGGTGRRAAIEQLTKGLGAKVEALYYAFGENDVYLIIDAPDNVSVAAATLVASASGAVNVKTTVLLTPEEIDQATKKSVAYRPPGR